MPYELDNLPSHYPKKILGYSIGVLLFGLPFLSKRFNYFFFPKIQKEIDDVSDNSSNKTYHTLLNHFISSALNPANLNARPTHSDLIKCGHALGYTFSFSGICRGYTMRWIEATILNQQDLFIERLIHIQTLNCLLIKGKTIDEIKQQPECEQALLNINAFYESLYIYQDPSMFRPIFLKHLNQFNIETISEIASSDEINNIGGIKSTNVLRFDEFTPEVLLETFEQLEEKINASQYQAPVCFLLSCIDPLHHAINVTYYPTDRSWLWMDINLKAILNFKKLTDLVDYIDKLEVTSNCNKYIKSFRIFSIEAILPKVNSEILEKTLKKIFKFKIAKDPIVNQCTLYLASLQGDPEVVKALLEQEGINPNQSIRDSLVPLYVAVQNSHLTVVNILLEQEGIDPNQGNADGLTPLNLAAQLGSLEIVQELLKKEGIALDQADAEGATPLFMAVQEGYLEIVQALLEKGANPNLGLIKDGQTPLSIAVECNNAEIVRCLLTHPQINIKVHSLYTQKNLEDFAIENEQYHPGIIERINAHISNFKKQYPEASNIYMTPSEIAYFRGYFDIYDILEQFSVTGQLHYEATIKFVP